MGAQEHFARTVAAVRERTGAAVEVLPSDFAGNGAAVDLLADTAPEVYNHNTETVPRLYREVRGRKSDYRWTLEMFRRIKCRAPQIRTKTGLMLGLGETHEELFDTLADLLDVGCEALTLGQYLQPTLESLPVLRYAPPEELNAGAARGMGFRHVASGPFVRSIIMPERCSAGNENHRPRHVIRTAKGITVRCTLSLTGRRQGEGCENPPVIPFAVLKDASKADD